MKLATIWSLPAMSFRERVSRTVEAGWRTLAHHLPRRLAYWSYIDTGVRAINPNEVVPEVHYIDILDRIN